MAAALPQHLQPIDLLKICGNIEYEWVIKSDSMNWQGSLSRLISPNLPLATGNSFNHLLSPRSFIKRLKGFNEARKAPDPFYSILYTLALPDYERAYVLEEGKISNSQKMQKCEGYIRFVNPLNFQDISLLCPEDFSGYDSETGLPNREVFFENLASILEQLKYTHQNGTYLVLMLDKMAVYILENGVEKYLSLMKEMVTSMRTFFGPQASIGRLSSVCIGIALPAPLQGCSTTIAANFKEHFCKNDFFKLNNMPPPDFIVAVDDLYQPGLEIRVIMQQSEKNLLEKQVSGKSHEIRVASGIGFL